MRRLYFLLMCLIFSIGMTAQENLSKEEKERRERNIQAANPFKQFGYKGKVATLSKGKYLEVHDLDSIVTIGSVRFHVDRKEIVGVVEVDTLLGDYSRPIGDLPSRWLSPDPLAEEFTNWSPYTFAFNSPLIFKDPDGRAAFVVDFEPTKEGHLRVEKGDNAAKLRKEYGVAAKDKNFKFKEGNVILLDNNATRAIAKSKGGSVEDINNGNAKFDVKNDNYVCDQCAQMANNGEELTPDNASKYGQFPDPMKFESTPGYSEVGSFDNMNMGEGIASIGGQHTVSYYSKSNDGTVYVLTKNGREAKPAVLPLTQVISDFNKNQNTNLTITDVKYYKKDSSK
jgi:hypothetical protein